MLWQGRRESSNVDDRRGMGGRGMAVGGGIGGIIIAIIYFFLGGGNGGSGSDDLLRQQAPQTQEQTAAQDQLASFSKVVLADTEDVWNKLLSEQGRNYVEPKMVLFSGSDQSGCGFASAATGPFYCPADSKIYLDLTFFQELQEKFNAPGDFAMAYVIAHEVGHHVQHLLGVTEQVNRMRGRISETEMNKLSVRLELQADFLAGVWAHHAQRTKQILQSGDLEEALGAANAIGDDRLQKQSQGYVVPDAFTHGTSEQRMYWFKKGFQTGDLKQGDTFNSDI
jgi:predicted metalloprotease